MPYLISNGDRAAVIFYLASAVDLRPSVELLESAEEEVGVVMFDGVHDAQFGGLNDEALEGHPLAGVGVRPYAAHEVVNSEWIAESERRNSAHQFHRAGWQQRLKHYVLCFHDDTLECIAAGLRSERHPGSFEDAVLSVTRQLLRP